MNFTATRLARRAAFLALLTVLAVLPALARPAAAATIQRVDTVSRDNEPLQTCGGFDVVGSFTLARLAATAARPGGTVVWERDTVLFKGTASNDAGDKWLAYDGGFTRTADLEAGTVAITDLVLRLTPPGGAATEIRVARTALDVPGWPPDLLMAVGPPVLAAHLCDLLTSG